MRAWVRDPHAGGVKIPKRVQERTKQRLAAYAETHYAGKYPRLDIRFRGAFCYIDAYTEPAVPADFPPPGFPESREAYLTRVRSTPTHLCRLRYFGNEDAWTFAFYTYSHEQYEPCVLNHGTVYGTPEEAFEAAAVSLQDEAEHRGQACQSVPQGNGLTWACRRPPIASAPASLRLSAAPEARR